METQSVFVGYQNVPNARKDHGFKTICVVRIVSYFITAGNLKYDNLQSISTDYQNFKMYCALKLIGLVSVFASNEKFSDT
jgi:hypothetical protein